MIRLRTLGALDLRGSEGQELRALLAQPKRAALLAYFALATPRGLHRRDTLLALFWPEQDSEHARNALSQAVHFLRRSLGAEVVVASNGDGLGLEWKDFWCDAVAFEEALDRDRPTEALDLYRGNLLEGFHVVDAPEFEQWLETERARLGTRYAQALETLAQERETAGDHAGAVRLWRRLASRDPYSSRLALRLMRALAAAGDPGEAVRHARSHEALLREELEVAPDPEVGTLVRQLQSAARWEEHRRSNGTAEQISRSAGRGLPSPRASVAVLPFLNLSPDREDEYFSEGMTEEILNALTKVPGLKVASRTSALAFHRKGLDIRSIAERLGVRAVLEGSVRRAEDRVRITAQLINAADGYHLWSETYDRKIADVFAVQDEISHAIVEAMELRLSKEMPVALVRSGTSNLEAYELYLKGRYFWNIRTPESLQKGIRCFEQAVAADPEYALPHSGLADTYHLLALYGMMPAREAYPKAKTAALRALEINEHMAEGHSSLACVALSYEHDWMVSEREFKRAIQLDPTYVPAHHWYSWFLIAMNRRNEAVEVIRHAVEIEPLSTIILARAGHIHYYAGQPHEGLRYCKLALDLDPNFAVAHEVSALIYSQLLQIEQAVAALDQLGTRPPSRAAPILLPYIHGMVGRPSEARAMLDALGYSPEAGRAPTGYLPLWVCATYALVGELDTAFRWLAYMYEERSFSVLLCHVEPGFDALRLDSRFQQWLIRIGLPVSDPVASALA
jgi:TolB-like protein/Tfp pilus assembly protein PilF